MFQLIVTWRPLALTLGTFSCQALGMTRLLSLGFLVAAADLNTLDIGVIPSRKTGFVIYAKYLINFTIDSMICLALANNRGQTRVLCEVRERPRNLTDAEVRIERK